MTDEQMATLFDQGKAIDEIAAMTRRSSFAVQTRITRFKNARDLIMKERNIFDVQFNRIFCRDLKSNGGNSNA